MPENITITISRQMGSGGSHIGRKLASNLGFKYVDREIVRQVANHLKEEESLLIERDERIMSPWERILNAFSLCAPETGHVPPVRSILDEDLFAVEAMIIRKIASHGSAVIVGRGAFHILAKDPGLIKVFLHASPEFRIRRVMDIFHITDYEKAKTLTENSDKQRGKFIKSIARIEWMNTTNYHLSIDTGVVGFTDACEMILRRARTMLANP